MIKKLYDKSEFWGFGIFMFIYGAGGMIILNLFSETVLGTSLLSAYYLILSVLIYLWIKKHNLKDYYGFRKLEGSYKDYLLFIPLMAISTVNFWNGIVTEITVGMVLIGAYKALGGFIEEVIFRGFLFNAIRRGENIKTAIAISSLTFGAGHIVNLLTGAELVPTLIQICYAVALGFLFTVIFYKGKRLLPCILSHAFINFTSVFQLNKDIPNTGIIISIIILIAVSVGYGVYILMKKPKKETA